MSIGLGIAIAGIVIAGAILVIGGSEFVGGSMLGCALVLTLMRSA